MSWLLYGANGYTGELCAREAAARRERPVLAGRNREAVERLAHELGLESRVFGLDSPTTVAENLKGVAAVLHCAGPFALTAKPMLAACLESGTHYLDITGEIAVFERVFRLDEAAREAGVTLLPGVGFDIVPTDGVAARLAEAVPDATDLVLAFHSEGGSMSRGTLKTMLEGLPNIGAIREGGRIRAVPAAFDTREIEFGCGPRMTMTIPWGDVSTAFRTTGIPNIRVYNGTPPAAIRRMRRLRALTPIAGLKPVKRLLQWWVGRTVVGPSAEVRESARVYLWGRAEGPAGAREAAFETPEGYAFTALAAVEAATRLLKNDVQPGALTPSLAFGSDFAEGLPGVGPLTLV